MVIGKEENENSFIFRKMKALIMTMITGTEHSVAFYILPRAFGVVIISAFSSQTLSFEGYL